MESYLEAENAVNPEGNRLKVWRREAEFCDVLQVFECGQLKSLPHLYTVQFEGTAGQNGSKKQTLK